MGSPCFPKVSPLLEDVSPLLEDRHSLNLEIHGFWSLIVLRAWARYRGYGPNEGYGPMLLRYKLQWITSQPMKQLLVVMLLLLDQ